MYPCDERGAGARRRNSWVSVTATHHTRSLQSAVVLSSTGEQRAALAGANTGCCSARKAPLRLPARLVALGGDIHVRVRRDRERRWRLLGGRKQVAGSDSAARDDPRESELGLLPLDRERRSRG